MPLCPSTLPPGPSDLHSAFCKSFWSLAIFPEPSLQRPALTRVWVCPEDITSPSAPSSGGCFVLTIVLFASCHYFQVILQPSTCKNPSSFEVHSSRLDHPNLLWSCIIQFLSDHPLIIEVSITWLPIHLSALETVWLSSTSSSSLYRKGNPETSAQCK